MKAAVKNRNGINATKTELLRMLNKGIELNRIVDFWRNPVEKCLIVQLDHLQNGEIYYC